MLLPLQTAASGLNEAAGLNDLQTARYLAAVFGAYPMALLFSSIPGRHAWLKHIVGSVLGIYLAQWVYGVQWIHSFLSSLVVYILVVAGSATPGIKHVVPWLVFAWSMLYMTGGHLYRQFVDNGGSAADWTGPQMVLTIKLIEFGWNYYDGMVARPKLQAAVDAGKVKDAPVSVQRKAAFAKSQLAPALEGTPNPIEFFSYIFNFTAYFVGPAFEMKYFLQAMDGSAYGPGRDSPPTSRLLNGASKLALALVYMAGYLVALPHVHLSLSSTPEAMADSSWYGILTSRLPMLWAGCVFGSQFKYYFIWKLSEGSAVWAGMGYGSKVGPASGKAVDTWHGVKQVSVTGFQFASSFGPATRAWNMRTQHWLEHYVYKRIPRVANINLFSVYFASAFWHGFYPGYYLTFMSAPLFAVLEKQLITIVNPLLYADAKGVPSKKAVQPRKGREVFAYAYTALCVLVTNITLDYTALPFELVRWDLSIAMWGSLHYALHVAALGLTVLAFGLPALGLWPKVSRGQLKPETTKTQ